MEKHETLNGYNSWIITVSQGNPDKPFEHGWVIAAEQTIRHVYSPSGHGDGSVLLTESHCEIAMTWQHSSSDVYEGRRRTYQARCRMNGFTPEVNLTDFDFIIDGALRGLGLGSWIMQQFVGWARTLPPDTGVKPIKVTKGDAINPENRRRRDSLWAGLGFRFSQDLHRSDPLCVRDLQVPVSRRSRLQVESLRFGELFSRYSALQQQNRSLESPLTFQREWIHRIEARQWDVMLRRLAFFPARLVRVAVLKLVNMCRRRADDPE